VPVLRRAPFLHAAAGAAAACTLAVAAVTGPAASASTAAPGAGNAAGTARGAAGPAFDCLTLASPTCYSPRQFRTAYGIAPLTARGITGRGETVVMPEFTATPGVTDVREDIARYDSAFGLPAANLRVITALAPGASPFQAPGEYAGDVEIVHAIAPQAAIQYAGRHLGFINPAIYEIGRGARYHCAFHDVTKGSNTVQAGSVTVKGFDAGPGWGPVTGWGSPNAQVLIPLLARHVTG